MSILNDNTIVMVPFCYWRRNIPGELLDIISGDAMVPSIAKPPANMVTLLAKHAE